jgi:hypothetical protein
MARWGTTHKPRLSVEIPACSQFTRALSCTGAAERTLQKFVVAKAKKARSPDELAAELHALGFPAGDTTDVFAQQLLARMPRAQSSNVRHCPVQQPSF